MSCSYIEPRSSSRARTYIGALLCLLALGFLPSAFAQKVSTEFDDAVDFSKFKTFAIREGFINSKSPALNSDLTKKRIESEIAQALTSKGLVAGTAGQVDLNVTFQFGSAREMVAKSYPAGWRGRGTRVVKVPQSEGTLVIDLHDSATNAMVWRSIAGEEEPNPIKLSEKLHDMVKKSIAKYPPKKAKK